MTDRDARGRHVPMAPLEAEGRIRTLVFEFYDRVRRDPLLGPVFEERLAGRWDEHLERMYDFWSTVLHATGRFQGDPIGVHARVPGLGSHHFDRWVMLFEQTASDVLPAEEAADVVRRSRRMRSVLERGARKHAEAAP